MITYSFKLCHKGDCFTVGAVLWQCVVKSVQVGVNVLISQGKFLCLNIFDLQEYFCEYCSKGYHRGSVTKACQYYIMNQNFHFSVLPQYSTVLTCTVLYFVSLIYVFQKQITQALYIHFGVILAYYEYFVKVCNQ